MSKFLADTYERIIIALLVIQYAFVNIVFTTTTQNIVIFKDLSAPLFSLLIFAFWVCGDLAKYGKWVLPRHGLVLATVAALLFWMTSVIAGPTTSYGVYLWSSTLGYFIQAWALLRFLTSYKRLSLFVYTVIITNVVIVGYGLSQLMGSDILVMLGVIPSWGSGVFVSTHGNQNFLAGYLICAFPMILGFWFVTRNPFLILALPVLVALNVYEVIESTARGAYIAIAVSVPLFIVGMAVNWRNLHILEDAWRKKIFQITGGVLVVAIVIGSALHADKVSKLGSLVYDQYNSIIDFEAQYTNWVRLIFFQMAIDGALRHPILGRGMGGFNQHMPETRPPWYHRWGVSHNTDHPHNEHLEWLHDTGIIGLTFFWLILVVYFRTGLRQIWRHRKSYYYPLLLAAFFGPWNQWIQATFDVETRWTGNNVTLWFTLGFVLAFVNLPVVLKREELEEKEVVLAEAPPVKGKKQARVEARRASGPLYHPHPNLPWIAGIMAVVILGYVVKARHFWLADYHLGRNMAFTDGQHGPTIAEAISDAERARELNYTNMSLYYKLAYTYLVAGKLEQALDAYRDLQAFAPNYAQIHINLAFLNDQLRFKTASAWERDRAAAIEHNTRNHRDAASYWLQLGYPVRALAHLRLCLTIEMDRLENGYHFWYDRDNLHTDLARIYAQLGELENAEKELKEALRFNPANVQSAVLLSEILIRSGRSEEGNALIANLTQRAPNNPALLVMNLQKAMSEKNYPAALDFARRVADLFTLPPVGGQASQEANELGNSVLSHLAVIAQAHNSAEAYATAGWIMAAQGRYAEAEHFLALSYDATKNPKTAERLGMVRARGKI